MNAPDMTGRWELIPRNQWRRRIRLCRERGRDYGWRDDTPGLPLSDYEPCEMCGTDVIGAVMPGGEKAVIELSAVMGDRERRTSALRFGARRHECKGRARGGQHA